MAAFTTPSHNNTNKSSTYPDALVIEPLRLPHKQTLILLHGQGSNASTFAPPLLSSILPTSSASSHTFQQRLPHTKFIFPTASKRRALSFKRSVITQWFDYFTPLTLETVTKREETMYPGLRETSIMLHRMLEREVREVGGEHVVLGGLSQGCAAALVAGLLWRGEALGAVVGLCGWLPLAGRLMEVLEERLENGDDDGDGDGIFFGGEGEDDNDGRVGGDNTGQKGGLPDIDTPTLRAIKFLEDELDFPLHLPPPHLPPSQSSTSSSYPTLPLQQTPIFLAHGLLDKKIPRDVGFQGRDCLRALGIETEWMDEEGQGHWYSGKMLERLIGFLEQRHVVEVGKGHSADTVLQELDDDGNRVLRKTWCVPRLLKTEGRII